MSRKAGLAKKIAHTLMAMSIVYSSGINIVINEAYAAEKTVDITNSSGGTRFEETGKDGADFTSGGKITDGESASIVGIIKDGTVTNDISVTAKGGNGGTDDEYNPTVMEGTKGGDAFAKVTVDESKNNVALGNITVKATGGSQGSTYMGKGQLSGAAAAYGLEVKHDLTINAQKITVESSSIAQDEDIVDTGSGKRKDVLAVGLQIDSGNVKFSGTGGIEIDAQNEYYSRSFRGDIKMADIKDALLSDGGDTEAYGIRIAGGQADIVLGGNLAFKNANNGTNYLYVGYNKSVGAAATTGKAADGGNGGATTAYGVEISGGLAHLELQDIESLVVNSNYFAGGCGGTGQSIEKQAGQEAIASMGGLGGQMKFAGVHTTGGKTNGLIGTIKVANKGGGGGNGGDGKGYIGGSGGNGGAAYAAGISAAGGELKLKVDGIELQATGGYGGSAGGFATSNERITASGKVGSVGGTGGTAFAFGLDNRGADTMLDVKNDIKLTAVGGIGGASSSSNGSHATDFTETELDVIAHETAAGAGGIAMAAGVQNAAGSLQATVKKLEIKTTGGIGGAGSSIYSSLGITGGAGGAAAAYGINILGGTASEVTAAEIVVQAEGGAGGDGGDANLYGDRADTADGTGCTGGKGGTGSTGAAYGVSNVGGAAAVTAAKITAQATGGKGGTGGKVYKHYSLTAKGSGGDGGDGGDAYAYGVYGSGSAKTMIAADLIVAEATAGAGGDGASITEGTATAGSNGSTGSKAEAYGVYAEQNAVIAVHAKTSGGTVKIGAKAKNAAANDAYAIYADNARVLFHDNAELNSDGSSADNTVLTYLNNAALGFGGTDANRTITGGTLQLAGSNSFIVNTDLAAGTADKITFGSLAAGSSTAAQYITVGYDAAIDPYKTGSTAATGGTPIDVLEITDLNGQNLDNFVGGTTSLDSVLYRFDTTAEIQKDVSGNKLQITGVTTSKTAAPSESVKTAADAQMAGSSMWRVEGNNLMKRMGDLRNDKEAAKGGVWARYYRGEMSADSAYDRSFDQDYTAFQGGIDKVQDYKGGKLYTGIAVNRIDGSAGYNSGSGDMSSTGVGVYASWLGTRGHYFDVIARGSKLANDFKLVDLSGNRVTGDYDTWAYGISTEYGYRQNLNAGWFVEPQAELSLGHIQSAGYELSNGARIENSGIDSAVARLGVLSGKEFTIGGRASNAYLKASVLHDFGGNGGTTGYYGADTVALDTGDLTGTWYEIGLGANLGIAKNSNLYFDALKTFNGNLRTEWQFNAGLRFSF